MHRNVKINKYTLREFILKIKLILWNFTLIKSHVLTAKAFSNKKSEYKMK